MAAQPRSMAQASSPIMQTRGSAARCRVLVGHRRRLARDRASTSIQQQPGNKLVCKHLKHDGNTIKLASRTVRPRMLPGASRIGNIAVVALQPMWNRYSRLRRLRSKRVDRKKRLRLRLRKEIRRNRMLREATAALKRELESLRIEVMQICGRIPDCVHYPTRCLP